MGLTTSYPNPGVYSTPPKYFYLLFSSVYCNMRPTRALHQSPFSIERDVTSRQGRQLLELLSLDRNVLLTKAKKLHLNTAATSPRPNDQNPKTANSSDTNLELDMPKLLELAHLVHYVYTPILFLPKWRYEAHSTRLRIRSEVIDSDANLLLPSLSESGKKKLRFSSNEEREHLSVLK